MSWITVVFGAFCIELKRRKNMRITKKMVEIAMVSAMIALASGCNKSEVLDSTIKATHVEVEGNVETSKGLVEVNTEEVTSKATKDSETNTSTRETTKEAVKETAKEEPTGVAGSEGANGETENTTTSNANTVVPPNNEVSTTSANIPTTTKANEVATTSPVVVETTKAIEVPTTTVAPTEAPTTHTHNHTLIETHNATCSEEGFKLFKCACGDSYVEPIAKTNHNYVSNVTREATCKEVGIITYTCTCGATYNEEIPTSEHQFDEWFTYEATYDYDRVDARRCQVCYYTENKVYEGTKLERPQYPELPAEIASKLNVITGEVGNRELYYLGIGGYDATIATSDFADLEIADWNELYNNGVTFKRVQGDRENLGKYMYNGQETTLYRQYSWIVY